MFACVSALAADWKSLRKQFDYILTTPFDWPELSVQERDGVQVHDVRYRSPINGSVPAYLVTLKTTAHAPIVLYGHCMMRGSPFMNRKEFLEESISWPRQAPFRSSSTRRTSVPALHPPPIF